MMGKNISAQKVVGNFRPYIYYIVVEKKSESVSNARAMHYTLWAKNDLKLAGNLRILSNNFLKWPISIENISSPRLNLVNMVVRPFLFTKSSLDKE